MAIDRIKDERCVHLKNSYCEALNVKCIERRFFGGVKKGECIAREGVTDHVASQHRIHSKGYARQIDRGTALNAAELEGFKGTIPKPIPANRKRSAPTITPVVEETYGVPPGGDMDSDPSWFTSNPAQWPNNIEKLQAAVNKVQASHATTEAAYLTINARGGWPDKDIFIINPSNIQQGWVWVKVDNDLVWHHEESGYTIDEADYAVWCDKRAFHNHETLARLGDFGKEQRIRELMMFIESSSEEAIANYEASSSPAFPDEYAEAKARLKEARATKVYIDLASGPDQTVTMLAGDEDITLNASPITHKSPYSVVATKDTDSEA